MDSIFLDIKHLLGIVDNDDGFDAELILHINSVFLTLLQLGIGPETGFAITGPLEKWSDFCSSTDNNILGSIKMLVYLKVRLIFDPPASSTVSEAMNGRIAELESRINWQAEENDEGAADS